MEKVKQMELALMPENVEDLYIDQAMNYDEFGERCFFAAYTPLGIHRIDTDFSRRIQNIGTDKTYTDRAGEEFCHENPENLRKDILDNTHLHPCIIENLILNLDNYIASMADEG